MHQPEGPSHVYLKDFRESEKRRNTLLLNESGDLRRYEDVSNSVAVTWQVTFDNVRKERPSAVRLLSLMSFFHAQNIPKYLLYSYNGASSEEQAGRETGAEFEDGIDVLKGYSLIILRLEDGYCEMHPLIQCCTRIWLDKFGNLTWWKRLLLCEMVEHFPESTYGTWPECRLMLPHVEPLLDEEPAGNPDLACWIDLLDRVAKNMSDIPQYSKREALIDRASAACQDFWATYIQESSPTAAERPSQLLTNAEEGGRRYTHAGTGDVRGDARGKSSPRAGGHRLSLLRLPKATTAAKNGGDDAADSPYTEKGKRRGTLRHIESHDRPCLHLSGPRSIQGCAGTTHEVLENSVGDTRHDAP